MQILKVVLGGNGKKSPKKSYANEYQKHIACIYAISCVDDKFSKPLKTCLACSLQIYNLELKFNFINSMIKEHTYCSEVMKNHFNKEIVMTKEDNKDFNSSTKFRICVSD